MAHGYSYELRLSYFWNPKKKSFNYTKLKEAMEGKGLNYSLLFKKADTYHAHHLERPDISAITYEDDFQGEGSQQVLITPESHIIAPNSDSELLLSYCRIWI